LAVLAAGLMSAVIGGGPGSGGAAAAEKELSPATESLFLAVKTNNFGAVKTSLLAGADVDALNENQRSPVDVAVDRGYFDIAHYLLAWRKSVERNQDRKAAAAAPPRAMATVAAEPEPAPPPAPVVREPVNVRPLAPAMPAFEPKADAASASAAAASGTGPVAPIRETGKIVPPDEVKTGDGTLGKLGNLFATTPEAAATAPQPTSAPAAPQPKEAPAADKGQSGNLLDAVVDFFKAKPEPEGPPQPLGQVAGTAPEKPAQPATAPTPVETRLAGIEPAKVAAANVAQPDTGTTKTKPDTTGPESETLFDSISRMLAESSRKVEGPPRPAAPEPQAARPLRQDAKPVVPEKTGGTAETTENLFDSIARVLAEAQQTPAAANPPVVAATPPAAETAQPIAAPAAPAAPSGTAANTAPTEPAEAEPARQVARAPAEPGAGQLLGRITDFILIRPKGAPGTKPQAADAKSSPPPTPPSADAKGKAEAVAPVTTARAEPAAAAPRQPAAVNRSAVEPAIGVDMRLGRHLPENVADACVGSTGTQTRFCVEPVDWPKSIADSFMAESGIYRGRQTIVRYDDGRATQFHTLFPSVNFSAVADYFTKRLGPPGERPDQWVPMIGEANRKNRMLRWHGPKPADGGGSVLEIREFDDLRWSSPPDMTHGVVRLYGAVDDTMFKYVSWSDFLLVRMRRDPH
jgi:hypothetical protein